jgi:Flp pilus assembly pilin Flp
MNRLIVIRNNPLQRVLLQIWTEEDGVLSFEWTLLLTLLTLGIVSGLSAARDAIIDELGDVAQAAGAMDQSYSFPALNFMFAGETFTTAGSTFTDDAMVYTDCNRTSAPNSSDAAAEFEDSDS